MIKEAYFSFEVARYCSSTLSWLEYDLLRKVEFDETVDTYEKDW